MKTTARAALAALLILLAVALGAGCGGSGGNGVASQTGAVGNPTDRAFIAAMVPHHRSAVAMARIATTEGTSTFVKRLARDIIASQSSEIALMQRVDRRLAQAGIHKGKLGMDAHAMGMEMRPDMLRGARPFDRKFMQMMVPHHEGAIAMATFELANGRNPRLKALARSIITAQQREVREMNARLKSSGDMEDMHGHSS